MDVPKASEATIHLLDPLTYQVRRGLPKDSFIWMGSKELMSQGTWARTMSSAKLWRRNICAISISVVGFTWMQPFADSFSIFALLGKLRNVNVSFYM